MIADVYPDYYMPRDSWPQIKKAVDKFAAQHDKSWCRVPTPAEGWQDLRKAGLAEIITVPRNRTGSVETAAQARRRLYEIGKSRGRSKFSPLYHTGRCFYVFAR